MFGSMRCSFYLNEFELSLTECGKVLNTEKLTPQQLSEAKYIKAKSLYETKRYDDALLEFKAMTKAAKNVSGAEAYYYIAKIQHTKQDYKEAVKTLTKLISYEYSDDDWRNKAMLLLADTYLATKEDADARVILETIIDSKPKQEYSDEAKKRMLELDVKEALEKKQDPTNNAAPVKDLQIEFNQTKKDSALFKQIKEENEGLKAAPSSSVELPK